MVTHGMEPDDSQRLCPERLVRSGDGRDGTGHGIPQEESTMDKYLPKEEWADFFDGFAKTHEDYEARLEIIGRLYGDQEEAAWLPLAGISYDPHHAQLIITVGGMSGRYSAHLTHTIDRPRMVHVGSTPDGEMISLLIVAPDKTETLVRLRPRPQ